MTKPLPIGLRQESNANLVTENAKRETAESYTRSILTALFGILLLLLSTILVLGFHLADAMALIAELRAKS